MDGTLKDNERFITNLLLSIFWLILKMQILSLSVSFEWPSYKCQISVAPNTNEFFNFLVNSLLTISNKIYGNNCHAFRILRMIYFLYCEGLSVAVVFLFLISYTLSINCLLEWILMLTVYIYQISKQIRFKRILISLLYVKVEM